MSSTGLVPGVSVEKKLKSSFQVLNKTKSRSRLRYILNNYELYLFLLPVIVHLAIFSYYTAIIQYMEFRLHSGIMIP